MLELLWLPFLACLVLAGIHAYLGLHVLARGVIFVDLALAQVAALGMTIALFVGYAPQSEAAYYYALAFTGAGAVLFALTREHGPSPAGRGIPQEAIIGIVYAVAAALTVLVLDRVAQGGEQIKQLLVGSILGVTGDEVARVAALYAVIGVVHWLCRRPLLAISLGQTVARARAWDFVFYLTFGLVVTSSVRIAGVLLVFSYLIVPAVLAAWLTPNVSRRLWVGWATGFVVSVVGLTGSYVWDLPTGATIVATFGAVLALAAVVLASIRIAGRVRAHGGRALVGAAVAAGLLVAIAGASLTAFPYADHFWLTALEELAPGVEKAFLTPYERGVLADSQAAIARGVAEARRLQTLQNEVQWGMRDMPDEQRERLRQFVLGRTEVVAGDRMVLRTLRQHARERQRLVLGLPLAAGGLVVTALAVRARRRTPPESGTAGALGAGR